MKQKFKVCLIWVTFFVIMMVIAGTWGCSKIGFDTDLLWHLKIGQDILETKTINVNNTYSWLPNTIWSQQEWLFGVIIYWISSTFDTIGYYGIHIVCIFSFIALCMKQNKFHFPILMPAYFLLLYIDLPFNRVNRPAEYSTYLFIFMIYMYNKRWKLKPLIFALCGLFIANFHCGTIVALTVMMGLLFASDVILTMLYAKEGEKHFDWRFITQYIISAVCFLGASCINPYGYKQPLSMFSVINLETTQYINEWQPYKSASYVSWIALLLIAVSLGYGIARYKFDKTEMQRIIVMAAFLVLGITSLKGFIIIFYIYMMYGYKYVDTMLHDFLCKIGVSNIYEKIDWPDPLPHKKKMYSFTLVCCMLFALGSALVNQVNDQDKMYRLVQQNRDDYASAETVDYLVSVIGAVGKENFRLLNGYVTGNFLLYNDIPVFIDTRQFPYASEFGWSEALDDYFGTNSNDYDAMDEFFEKYDFNYALSCNEYNIDGYLSSRSEWQRVFSDAYGNRVWEKKN